jgi:hypothetical protein
MSGNIATHPSSTIRPQAPMLGAHSVTVAFSVWGTQPTSVMARDGGGPQDRPYIAVSVGDCLTYVYDPCLSGSRETPAVDLHPCRARADH